MVQNILGERPLTASKEKAALYLDGEGLKNNQKEKKEDTSMEYFPKIAYRRPLVPNVEGVYEKTNTYLKNTRA